ncbi:enoyl-CoA hydratase/isomerase family protein [Bradyrhizobium sp. ORS 111]|uniref:enoyl-CoA hydratase/isomerase family protein n=1 Tax=Bradyrhizobium sp. ORS 111 TaxID=1685958 RepID=UPI00388EB564
MIRSEKSGSIGIITIDRPDRRNALGTTLIRTLSASLRRLDADDTVRAVIITGAPPAFCAGSDLKELASLSSADMREHEAETASVVRSISALTKPVIASVEGYALGGGFMLAIACDVVVSSGDAKWHLPEVPSGWLPIWGMRALMSRVGPMRARLLSWGAEKIDGHEAQRLGIVDYVVDNGEALGKALDVAKGLAALPSEAVSSVKTYFQPFVMMDAEQLDVQAHNAFARDCLSEAAQATMSKYRQI